MKQLRVAGILLSVHGLIMVLGALILFTTLCMQASVETNIVYFLLSLFLLLVGLVLSKIGAEVCQFNPRYRKASLIAAAMSTFSGPIGIVLGPLSLLFLLWGRDAYR